MHRRPALVVIIIALVTVAKSHEPDSQLRADAKKAASRGLGGLDEAKHGLVLVPVPQARPKRSMSNQDENDFNQEDDDDDDDDDTKPKYKRLSHSVHVQSDIRYR